MSDLDQKRIPEIKAQLTVINPGERIVHEIIELENERAVLCKQGCVLRDVLDVGPDDSVSRWLWRRCPPDCELWTVCQGQSVKCGCYQRSLSTLW
jgi:hypothetical protein